MTDTTPTVLKMTGPAAIAARLHAAFREQFDIDDLNRDPLAPHELARTFSGDTLDDLDNRARAIAYGWHEGEMLEQDIMAVANALPKLTAALRRAPCF